MSAVGLTAFAHRIRPCIAEQGAAGGPAAGSSTCARVGSLLCERAGAAEIPPCV